MIVRRLGQLVLVLFLVTLFTAMLVHLLPGDVAETMIPFGHESDREALRDDLGLNESVPEQYWRWVSRFATGDFGHFYRQGNVTAVADRVVTSAPVSLQLVVYAQLMAMAIAIPAGVLSASRADSLLDRSTNGAAFAVLCVPNFILGLVLAYVVGVRLEWLPPQGYVHPSDGLIGHMRSMALPSVSLAAGQIAIYMRLLRNDMVATLQEDFVFAARGKGLSTQRILWRHAFRPSSLTLLTVAGLNLGTLVGGAVILEVIFNLDGMGRLMFEAISERQIVALQSLVALVAVGYVVLNLLVDILYSIVDPRIRHDHH